LSGIVKGNFILNVGYRKLTPEEVENILRESM
jgi:hypothetical protein